MRYPKFWQKKSKMNEKRISDEMKVAFAALKLHPETETVMYDASGEIARRTYTYLYADKPIRIVAIAGENLLGINIISAPNDPTGRPFVVPNRLLWENMAMLKEFIYEIKRQIEAAHFSSN